MVPVVFHRRRSYYSLFVTVLLVGMMYLAFQLFTYEALTEKSAEIEALHWKQWQKMHKNASSISRLNDTDQECAKFPQLCHKDKVKEHSEGTNFKEKVSDNIRDKVGNFKNKLLHAAKRSDNVPIDNLSKHRPTPRGVLPKLAHLYIPNKLGMFTCIKSMETIPIERVNDDYCDCLDSSDEPGTAACLDSKFFCAFQLTNEEISYPASRVNDGICDCCDGSDEWNYIHVKKQVYTKDKKPAIGVFQAPCIDRCDDLRKVEEERIKLMMEGMRLKEHYLMQGKGKNNQNQIYGLDGAFYPLSEQCYSIVSIPYNYKVCPFKKVQQESPDTLTYLGDTPSWLSRGGPDGYKLLMGRGQSKNCPGAIERSAVIEFICGLEDQVLQVSEQELCKYYFKFSTPAACGT